MSIKQSLRLVLGLIVVAAPLAFIGCDESKPAAPAAGAAAAPAAAPGAPGEAPAKPAK